MTDIWAEIAAMKRQAAALEHAASKLRFAIETIALRLGRAEAALVIHQAKEAAHKADPRNAIQEGSIRQSQG